MLPLTFTQDLILDVMIVMLYTYFTQCSSLAKGLRACESVNKMRARVYRCDASYLYHAVF